jgi:hypothetical protein
MTVGGCARPNPPARQAIEPRSSGRHGVGGTSPFDSDSRRRPWPGRLMSSSASTRLGPGHEMFVTGTEEAMLRPESPRSRRRTPGCGYRPSRPCLHPG